ncbi:hypothetical protein NA56DRAFT_647792 [Hyaloscypha hepaticicola]|uniref:Uncharacterized protein n=1 Tax=Hyaloscypha hepaticicola TaxID=2082293 RepID=A0A2J6PX62_9HELO|nr:hypothetical protein NA56DRAFT_647792 [Hyaloscypha hepaticicola]
MVSSDSTISIIFGIVSIFISLLGVFVAYLSLRAMVHDQQGRHHQLAMDEGAVRHEHIHVLAARYGSRLSPYGELRWRE